MQFTLERLELEGELEWMALEIWGLWLCKGLSLVIFNKEKECFGVFVLRGLSPLLPSYSGELHHIKLKSKHCVLSFAKKGRLH